MALLVNHPFFIQEVLNIFKIECFEIHFLDLSCLRHPLRVTTSIIDSLWFAHLRVTLLHIKWRLRALGEEGWELFLNLKNLTRKLVMKFERENEIADVVTMICKIINLFNYINIFDKFYNGSPIPTSDSAISCSIATDFGSYPSLAYTTTHHVHHLSNSNLEVSC